MIAGATVTIADGPNAGKTATTDSSGAYALATLQASDFTVTVSASNYASISKAIHLTANQTASFTLEAKSAPAPAVPCTLSLSVAATIDGYPNGGTFPVTVTTGTGCAWSVAADAAWIHLQSPQSGTGSGTFTFTTDANTSNATRSGAVTISAGTANKLITLNQTAVNSLAVASIEPQYGVIGAAQTIPMTVRLSGPASAGGFVVNLTSSNSALTVPASLSVPAGSTSASVDLTARSGAPAVSVVVTGAGGGQSRSASLQMWPVFFQMTGRPWDFTGRSQPVRVDAGSPWTFTGDAGANGVMVSAQHATDASQFWQAIIGAPQGQTMRPGVYRNAKGTPALFSSEPRLWLSGTGGGCNASTGEFEVLEFEYVPPLPNYGAGALVRFHVTFKLTCDGGGTPTTGEIQIATPVLFCRYTHNC